MKWFSAWLRTRARLRELKRQIAVRRILIGEVDGLSIKGIVNRHKSSDQILVELCREYLMTKRIGADATILYKLSDGRVAS